MKCPVCNASLVKTKRQGVEIDYCPHYCGVWLDRGELDKIIKRLLRLRSQNGAVASGDAATNAIPTDELFDFD